VYRLEVGDELASDDSDDKKVVVCEIVLIALTDGD
jgi:hypothetical protein